MTEVAWATLYMHQTSGMCTGMCACNQTHQMEKSEPDEQPDEKNMKKTDEKQMNNQKKKTHEQPDTTVIPDLESEESAAQRRN